MGTEVLPAQDCLAGGVTIPGPAIVFTRRSSAGKARSARMLGDRDESRRRTSTLIQIHRNLPAKGLEMGQVRILRRGESFPEVMMCELRTPKKPVRASATAAADDLILFGMGRLGPEPASLPIFWQDPYAGPACINSPAPSDVPLPSFKKKTASRIVDDSATRDLRRLLGLG